MPDVHGDASHAPDTYASDGPAYRIPTADGKVGLKFARILCDGSSASRAKDRVRVAITV